MDHIEKNWAKDCQVLVGKTIKSVGYLPKKQCDEMDWENRPLVIMFTDGTYIFPSMDNEGNDGGALFTNIKNLEIIPVL